MVYSLSLSQIIANCSISRVFTPHLSMGGGWRLYVDLSKQNPCGSWVGLHQKKKVNARGYPKQRASYVSRVLVNSLHSSVRLSKRFDVKESQCDRVF